MVLMTALVLLASAVPAYGVPATSAKQDEARRVKKQIDQLDSEVEIAAEAYNEANAAHQKLIGEIAATQAELDKTNARIGTLQGHLTVRANSMYRSGPVGFIEVLLSAKDFSQFAATWDLLREMNQLEADNVSELKDGASRCRGNQG